MIILLKIKAFNTEEICVWFFYFLKFASPNNDKNSAWYKQGWYVWLLSICYLCAASLFTYKPHLWNAFVLSALDKHIPKFQVRKNHLLFYRWEFWDIEVSWLAKTMPIFRDKNLSLTLQHCSHLQGFFIPNNIYYRRREHWMIKSRLRKVEFTQLAGARVKSILFSREVMPNSLVTHGL